MRVHTEGVLVGFRVGGRVLETEMRERNEKG